MSDNILEHFMREAFARALTSSHDGGRVEVHVGEGVAEALGAFCTEQVDGPERAVNSAWGFPVVVAHDQPRHHISVHTVYTIA